MPTGSEQGPVEKPSGLQQQQQLAVSIAEAARMTGISKSGMYRYAADGTVPAVRLQGRVLIPLKALEELFALGFSADNPDRADNPATA